MKKPVICFSKRILVYGLCGMLFCLLVIGSVCAACSRAPQQDAVFFPVAVGEEVIPVERTEYIACCALAAAGEARQEALMQAVCIAVNTNAWYMLQRMESIPANGYGMVWTEKEVLIEKYGETCYNKWYHVAKDIQNVILMYGSEPILAAFYPGGFGISESAASVWGRELPYLTHIRSGDLADESLTQRFHFTKEALLHTLGSKEVCILSRGESGRVNKLSCGEEILTGREAAKRLGLSSEIFSIIPTEDGVDFVCFGAGAQVGMSIAGARRYAAAGEDAKALLGRFYPGTRLQELTEQGKTAAESREKL